MFSRNEAEAKLICCESDVRSTEVFLRGCLTAKHHITDRHLLNEQSFQKKAFEMLKSPKQTERPWSAFTEISWDEIIPLIKEGLKANHDRLVEDWLMRDPYQATAFTVSAETVIGKATFRPSERWIARDHSFPEYECTKLLIVLDYYGGVVNVVTAYPIPGGKAAKEFEKAWRASGKKGGIKWADR